MSDPETTLATTARVMTEVKFHFNVADRTDYACRLLRKATRQGASVVVTGSAAVLARFDRDLWTFDALEFLPHVLLPAGAPVPVPTPEHLRATRIWLSEDAGASGGRDVLVHLSANVVEPPAGFAQFARVIDIVSLDPQERLAARQRWKQYAAHGCGVSGHEAAPA